MPRAYVLKVPSELWPEATVGFMLEAKDREDAHGEKRKDLVQHVFLPHEIVDCFIKNGELQRMIGQNEEDAIYVSGEFLDT